MSHEEKNVYAALTKTFLIFGVFTFWMAGLYHDGRFEGPDAAALVGKSFIALMLAGIAAYIVLTILFNIAFAIAQNDPKPDFTVDERDKLIKLKGANSFLMMFTSGFAAAMVALALGVPPVTVFFAMIFALFLGSVADDATKIYLYRRGL